MADEAENEKSPEDEMKELRLQNTKLARELRITRNYLDKVTKTVEAKEALGKALETANAKQKAYTDMLLENCPNIIILLDDSGRLVLSTQMFLTLMGVPNFNFVKSKTWE